jgi:iron complex outermembrane receptor protein
VINPANGQIVCNVTLTNPGAYPGCVPINMFGPTSASPEAISYILTRTGFNAVTTQDQVGGSIAGSPFSTWAGPVQVALSGEYRKLSLNNTSNVNPNSPINCTGIRFNCPSTLARYQTNALASSSGSQEVKEVAFEGDVPLLRDTRFFKELSLNGAARYTDYRTSGGVTTWKLGLVWSPDDQITFRATRSRDIRAPNLNELFAPTALSPGTVIDRHVTGNPQVTASNITRSNLDLTPEVAKTYTVGVVLKPRFLPNFSISADYFSISIDNAITTLTGASPTVQNICEASNGTSTFCSLLVRPLPFADRTAANVLTATYTQPVNAASFKTEGVDVEANYRTGLLAGALALRGLVTYQPKADTQQGASFPVLQNAGVAPLAKVRATAQATYAIGPFTLNVQERFRSSSKYNHGVVRKKRVLRFCREPVRSRSLSNGIWLSPDPARLRDCGRSGYGTRTCPRHSARRRRDRPLLHGGGPNPAVAIMLMRPPGSGRRGVIDSATLPHPAFRQRMTRSSRR